MVISELDGKVVVGVRLTEEFSTPYRIGIVMAMAGRIALNALQQESKGNPNLMEQAQAQMTEAFVKDMQLPSSEPTKKL